jgi:hypothetical protein
MNIKKTNLLIEHFCLKDNLSSYDPYDIWKTKTGVNIKKLYFKNKFFGFLPATFLTLTDFYLVNKSRFLLKSQEYPIVRAQAGISLINLYLKTSNKEYLDFARKHLDWLLLNYSKNYSGLCWGTGFKIVINSKTVYDENSPFTTNTPYILEFFHAFYKITQEQTIRNSILSIYNFYEKDIIILKETDELMITSYGTFADRIVTNSVSYTMFAYSIFYQYMDNKPYIESKIKKLYNFICSVQQIDGSWIYAPYDENSFIDCFHSCFILKNLIKTSQVISLDNSNYIIDKGYSRIRESFYCKKTGLFNRFISQNKPSIVKYDLYDNSEVLNVAILLNDVKTINSLTDSIFINFIRENDIFSLIDLFGVRKNKNTLRWAVMPYLMTISKL